MLLNAQQFRQIQDAVTGLSPTQLAWIGGYFSGLSQSAVLGQLALAPDVAVASTSLNQSALQATVLYGSQTGNSKKLATQLQTELSAQGVEAKLVNMKDYRPQQLKKEQYLFIVVSTHGNGEPPDEARAFFKFLHSDRAPKLPELQYSVLALGDSSYEGFCQSGNELDARLAELGAKRLVQRMDCDVDFANHATQWRTQVLEALPKAETSNVIPLRPNLAAQQVQQGLGYSAQQPYQAELLAKTRLTTDDSAKEVLHIELSLADSGLQYQPGDILAVLVENDADLIAATLAAAHLSAESEVLIKGKAQTLAQALRHLELTTVTRKQIKDYAEATANAVLKALAHDKQALAEWQDADWVDVLSAYPAKLNAQQLVDLLRPLQARQYSIASSLAAHPDEVHLLVKRVEYQHLGRTHSGVASNCLAQAALGATLAVYVKANDKFKLPSDPKHKIIMIGAGTGVAPFRSFLFEREAQGIEGNTWLFFGEQRFRHDFLYQVEWQQLLKNGTLERMSVAFSRDQAEKVYIQQRIREQGADLYQWLQQGASVYVCGDMHHMAKDVHAALRQVLVEHGTHSAEQAEAQLEQWISNGRYQRDVY